MPVRRNADTSGSLSSSVTVPFAAVSIHTMWLPPFASARSSSRHATRSRFASMPSTSSLRRRLALAVDADLRVELDRARIEIHRADEDALAIEHVGLRMQRRLRRAERRFLLRRLVGRDGLEFVEPHARFEQILPVALIARVHGGDVGGRERVGQHRDAHAARRHAAQPFDAGLAAARSTARRSASRARAEDPAP